jgi:hypothetical protein
MKKLNFSFTLFNYWVTNRFTNEEHINIRIFNKLISYKVNKWNWELCFQKDFSLFHISSLSNVWVKYEFEICIYPIQFRIYQKH